MSFSKKLWKQTYTDLACNSPWVNCRCFWPILPVWLCKQPPLASDLDQSLFQKCSEKIWEVETASQFPSKVPRTQVSPFATATHMWQPEIHPCVPHVSLRMVDTGWSKPHFSTTLPEATQTQTQQNTYAHNVYNVNLYIYITYMRVALSSLMWKTPSSPGKKSFAKL